MRVKNEELDKNEEILDVLEEKKLEDYVKEYYALRHKIYLMLGKLKNWGVDCDCDDVDYFTIRNDNDDETHVCIDCGGSIKGVLNGKNII